MHIQINFGDVEASETLRARVNEQVQKALAYVRDEVTRVEVHLRDDNAGKGGSNDKRAVMEARPAGHQPITVEDSGEDLYRVIDSTAQKLGRAVTTHLERHGKR